MPPLGFGIERWRLKLNSIWIEWVILLAFDECCNEVSKGEGPCRTASSVAQFDFIQYMDHLVEDQCKDVNPKPKVESMQGAEEVPSPLLLVA